MHFADKWERVELCTACMCLNSNDMSIPVHWKEGLSPTVEATLRQKTADALCRHSCHRSRNQITSWVLYYSQYKIGKKESFAIDMSQFAFAIDPAT